MSKQFLVPVCTVFTSPYLSGVLNPQDYQGGALWELARGCPFKCAYCYESKGEKPFLIFLLKESKTSWNFLPKKNVSSLCIGSHLQCTKKQGIGNTESHQNHHTTYFLSF